MSRLLSRKPILLLALLALFLAPGSRLIAPFIASAAGQTAFTLYSALKGTEIVADQANPTGGSFTTKLLVTGGLAAVASTVSALPTCNAAAKGTLYVVTDASSPTYGASLTGGSSTVALALCTGSAWTAH